VRTPQEIESAFAPRHELRGRRAFFLLGAGGAGLSGVARMLLRRGFRVRGVDATGTPLIEALRAQGAEIWIGHRPEAVSADDAVILSDAIPLDAPEVVRAIALGCPVFRRSQALGWLLEDKRCVCVTGTHGKTTTTGMIAAGLRAAGLDPTIVAGAEVPAFGGAFHEGAGDLAVVEACEAYDSLRDLDPFVAVVTNLEPDHLDFHGDWAGLRSRVAAFLERTPPEGRIVALAHDPGIDDLLAHASLKAPVVRYELSANGVALPGRHNALNAAAALAACRAIAPGARVWPAIAAFEGAERRLQTVGEAAGRLVLDDYAHHPTEITASIQAVRERHPDRRLVVVYQPHLYSRTATLLDGFAEALSEADLLFLTDIYPAREDPIPGISSARIAELARCPVRYVPNRRLLPREVACASAPGDVIAGMGAGDIGEFAQEVLEELRRLERASRTANAISVAVVYGGDSAEREVSILSGRAVAAALERKGYAVERIDCTDRLLSGAGLASLTGPRRPDVAFLCVHGTHAEDGAIQGLFELLHLPYTGSRVQASAIAIDKQLAKRVLADAGLPVPRGVIVDGPAAALAPSLGGLPDIGWPGGGIPERVVVKPNSQGSTIGLTFVERAEDLAAALTKALAYGPRALVEEWVEGVEISVPVLGDRPLPAVEIVPASGRYDFAAKYTPGATEEICPPRLPAGVVAKAEAYALAAHRALGCSGATRTDMIVRGDEIVVLEVNTLPGLTPTSLLPRSAAAAGMAFEDLCAWMVEDALARGAER
jgi:D-alanine--D-alanine ligase